jgi:hypothetical protein
LYVDSTGAGAGANLFWNNNDAGTADSLAVYSSDLDLLINGNTYDYEVTVTNANGCSATSNLVTVNVVSCGSAVTLTTKLYLEGYYAVGSGPGLMDNLGGGGALYYQGFSTNPTDVDTVRISAMDATTYALVEEQTGILQTNGDVTVTFSNAVSAGTAYYIRVTHRNAIETWSGAPVMMSTSTSYNFTDAASKAYGNNPVLTGDGMFYAFYSGDISDAGTATVGIQDGVIESQDYSDMENAVYITLGGYVTEDITGDGVVESTDYSIMENNVYFTIGTQHP